MKYKGIMYLLYILLGLSVVSACHPDKNPGKPNILLICIDDLRPEINSFGADHILSPHIDALTENGMAFHRHYVNAPSCGPSRYTLLTGKYGPSTNNALFRRSAAVSNNLELDPSMPEWFRQNGYTTVSVGKVSHHPGGLGGPDWDDTTMVEMPNAWDKSLMPVGEWQHPRGMMHGLAHGEIRQDPKDMDVYQSLPGADNIYPDGIITEAALEQLQELSAHEEPFFLAVGLIKPHLPFGAPQDYYGAYDKIIFPEIDHPTKPASKTSTWHNSGEFRRYNLWGKDPNTDKVFADELRRHYAACVSYADAQVGKIVRALKESGEYENTIIVLWGDHGWHLGEHAIWGKHSLYEEALRSPLIIQYPGMMQAGKKSNAIVETLDIFPTLCALTNVETPKFAQGKSLINILQDPTQSGHPAISYWGNVRTIRTESHRLTTHQNGELELYDHTSSDGETINIADSNPEMVDSLRRALQTRSSYKLGNSIDVILIGGQSNATGQGYMQNLPTDFRIDTTVSFYYSEYLGGAEKPMTWGPLCQASETPDKFGVELSLGSTLHKLRPNDNIAIIKHALSGSNLFQQWNPGKDSKDTSHYGAEYKKFVHTVNSGMDALKEMGYQPTIKAMVWQQGEADARDIAGMEYSLQYGHNLNHFIHRIRKDVQAEEMAFIYGYVIPVPLPRFTGREEVRDAQRRVDQNSGDTLAVKNAFVIETDDLQLRKDDPNSPYPEDVVHFGTEGILELGNRFAKKINDVLLVK